MKNACNKNGVKVDYKSSVNYKMSLPIVRCPNFFKARGHLSHFGQFLDQNEHCEPSNM